MVFVNRCTKIRENKGVCVLADSVSLLLNLDFFPFSMLLLKPQFAVLFILVCLIPRLKKVGSGTKNV